MNYEQVMLVQFQQYVKFYVLWNHFIHAYEDMLPMSDPTNREMM